MGRGHGSGRGASAKAGGFQGDASMKGYSAGLAKAMTARESEIRNERVENTSVFDDEGNELFRAVGTTHDVKIDAKTTPNHIVTHNHPGIAGDSFSQGDVVNYAFWNAKEIRAVTRNYTYSLKRPEGGWKGGHEKAYKQAKAKVDRADNAYFKNYKGDMDAADRRISRTYNHRVNKEFAKIMGYEYTKTKVH